MEGRRWEAQKSHGVLGDEHRHSELWHSTTLISGSACQHRFSRRGFQQKVGAWKKQCLSCDVHCPLLQNNLKKQRCSAALWDWSGGGAGGGGVIITAALCCHATETGCWRREVGGGWRPKVSSASSPSTWPCLFISALGADDDVFIRLRSGDRGCYRRCRTVEGIRPPLRAVEEPPLFMFVASAHNNLHFL